MSKAKKKARRGRAQPMWIVPLAHGTDVKIRVAADGLVEVGVPAWAFTISAVEACQVGQALQERRGAELVEMARVLELFAKRRSL